MKTHFDFMNQRLNVWPGCLAITVGGPKQRNVGVKCVVLRPHAPVCPGDGPSWLVQPFQIIDCPNVDPTGEKPAFWTREAGPVVAEDKNLRPLPDDDLESESVEDATDLGFLSQSRNRTLTTP